MNQNHVNNSLTGNTFNYLFDQNFSSFSVMIPSRKGSLVRIVVSGDNDSKPCDVEPQNRLNVPHRNSISSINELLSNDLNSTKNERSNSLELTNDLDGFNPNKRRISSISSLGNWTGAVIVSDFLESTEGNGKWY